MLLKFRVLDCKSLRSFLKNILVVGEDITNPASKIWSDTKIKISKSGVPKGLVNVELTLNHIIPTVIWKMGIFCLAFAFLFWIWFLIPASIFLFFGFMNTKLFMFSMLKLGLRKNGYTGVIKRLK